MTTFRELLIEIGLSEDEAELIYFQPGNSPNTLLLAKILVTLREMKKQEFEYWEAWKKAKNKEIKDNDDS